MVIKSAKVYRKIFIESILYPICYDQKKLDIWRIPFLVVRICESIVAAMIKELFSQPQVSQKVCTGSINHSNLPICSTIFGEF